MSADRKPLERATTWKVDGRDPFAGILTNEDGVVFEMRRCGDGVGWKPCLTAGEPIWNRYGGYGKGFVDRVGQSMLQAWSDHVDANDIPREVAPFSVSNAVKPALKQAQN